MLGLKWIHVSEKGPLMRHASQRVYNVEIWCFLVAKPTMLLNEKSNCCAKIPLISEAVRFICRPHCNCIFEEICMVFKNKSVEIYDWPIKTTHYETDLIPRAPMTLQWRHNDHVGVLNHQPYDCLLNRLFRRRSKRTAKLRVTGLCVGNSPDRWIPRAKGQ